MTGHVEGGTFLQKPGWSLRRSHREMTFALFSGFRGFLGARPARASLRAACGRRTPASDSLTPVCHVLLRPFQITLLQGLTRAGPHRRPLTSTWGECRVPLTSRPTRGTQWSRISCFLPQAATREERASVFQGTNSSACLFEFAVTLAGLSRHKHCARGRGPRTWLHGRNVPPPLWPLRVEGKAHASALEARRRPAGRFRRGCGALPSWRTGRQDPRQPRARVQTSQRQQGRDSHMAATAPVTSRPLRDSSP